MTTDYSKMTNAVLLAAYERETDVSERLYIYDMMEVRVNTAPSALEQLRILVDLDAARAEAQHLREQLDRILTAFKALTEASSSWDDWETSNHLLAEIARIAAEDASAQGGE